MYKNFMGCALEFYIYNVVDLSFSESKTLSKTPMPGFGVLRLDFSCSLTAQRSRRLYSFTLRETFMTNSTSTAGHAPRHWYRWLLVTPFIWQAALAPW